jgi:hypothetical protein
MYASLGSSLMSAAEQHEPGDDSISRLVFSKKHAAHALIVIPDEARRR